MQASPGWPEEVRGFALSTLIHSLPLALWLGPHPIPEC